MPAALDEEELLAFLAKRRGLLDGVCFTGGEPLLRPQLPQLLSRVLAVLISLVYIVEIIAKKILQSYYPLSTLGTAAGNRLTDYSEALEKCFWFIDLGQPHGKKTAGYGICYWKIDCFNE